MGYDFMLFQVKDATQYSFPCEYGELEIVEGTFPWGLIKDRILSIGTHDNMEPDYFAWDIGELGRIYVRGTDDYVSLDMHAEWVVVLELLEWVNKQDPNIVLFDESEGVFYDAHGFREFMKSQNMP